MQPYAKRQKRTTVLDGAIRGNLFFEPSTRTRVSFGTAFNLLGGEVRETTGTSSLRWLKRVVNSPALSAIPTSLQCDILRRVQWQNLPKVVVYLLSTVVMANEHPTQALLDETVGQRELEYNGHGIDGLRIAMIGDLRYGRTVHSLSRLLCLFKNIALRSFRQKSWPCLSPSDAMKMRTSLRLPIPLKGIWMDICYQTRIQEERFPSQEEANKYRGKFRLNQSIYTKHFQSKTVIMHPLPRDSRMEANELDNDLNLNPNLAIFRQTDNGVLVRMALFALTLV